MMCFVGTEDLKRLGHYVVSRRVEKGYRNGVDLSNELQFSDRVLRDIENGVRRASPGSYAMLENKLGWEPGSIEDILAGGEPTESAREHPELSFSMSDVSDEALLREVASRLAAFRRLIAGQDSEDWPPPSWDPKHPSVGRRQNGDYGHQLRRQ